jgi:hypothetical protein
MNESNQILTRYLLGEMAEAEQSALEEKYFADADLFDQLIEVENELTDKYARGQLSAKARQQFEQYYLAHPRLLQRVRFAQALTAQVDHLHQANDSTRSTESWWNRIRDSIRGPKLAWGLSLALLLLVAGVGWFAFHTRRLRQDIARSEAERARQEQTERVREQQLAEDRKASAQDSNELDRARSGPPNLSPTPSPTTPPAFATLILNISGARGPQPGTPPALNLPSGTEKVRLELNLQDVDYASYSVTIQRAGGREIFERDGVKSSGTTRVSLALIVPAERFAPGDYILTLKGVTPDGEIEDLSKSFFRVSQSRKP